MPVNAETLTAKTRPPTLRALLEAQAKDLASSQAALFIGVLKFTFIFETE